MNSRKNEYSDDIFAATRMSFGDHLEELRYRMWAALKALFVCVFLAFVLDWIGTQFKPARNNFGIGKPVMEFIKAPAEDQMNAFFDERAWKAIDENMGEPKNDEEVTKRDAERKRFMQECNKLRTCGIDAANQPRPLHVQINRDELRKAVEGNDGEHAEVTLLVPPVDLAVLTRLAQERVGKRNEFGTWMTQESFVVYFKVTLMCGFVMASPIIFYQFWAFVGAGLYPHEKRYVHIYLPFSLGLFLAGVFVCFAWVLPGAVKYLLSFNEWFGVDPDLRLNEWLSFALVLPLIFGLSFQTPLVMLFINRLGMITWQMYVSKWRFAVMVLALFSAVITPTTDVVTMMCLFVPMFGLYLLGIILCYFAVQPHESEDELANAEEIAV